MKKIIQKIKLKKFRNYIPEECHKDYSCDSFIVLYRNYTFKRIYSKSELIDVIQKHAKDICYVFDMIDRIILDKDILVNMDDLEGNK